MNKAGPESGADPGGGGGGGGDGVASHPLHKFFYAT